MGLLDIGLGGSDLADIAGGKISWEIGVDENWEEVDDEDYNRRFDD